MREFKFAVASASVTVSRGPPSGECCKSSIPSSLIACSATVLLTFLTCPTSNRMPCMAKFESFTSATNPGAGSTWTVIGLSPSNRSSAHSSSIAGRVIHRQYVMTVYMKTQFREERLNTGDSGV